MVNTVIPDKPPTLSCLIRILPQFRQEVFVHRDLMRKNTARNLDGRWYLLDLEMCAQEGKPEGTSRPRSWDNQTLVAGSYSTHVPRICTVLASCFR